MNTQHGRGPGQRAAVATPLCAGGMAGGRVPGTVGGWHANSAEADGFYGFSRTREAEGPRRKQPSLTVILRKDYESYPCTPVAHTCQPVKDTLPTHTLIVCSATVASTHTASDRVSRLRSF